MSGGLPTTSLSGLPDALPSSIDALFWIFLAVCCAFLMGIAYLFGFQMGQQNIWELEHMACTKTEIRKFADTGFMFFSGSGEISDRKVCVEWVVTR